MPVVVRFRARIRDHHYVSFDVIYPRMRDYVNDEAYNYSHACNIAVTNGSWPAGVVVDSITATLLSSSAFYTD